MEPTTENTVVAQGGSKKWTYIGIAGAIILLIVSWPWLKSMLGMGGASISGAGLDNKPAGTNAATDTTGTSKPAPTVLAADAVGVVVLDYAGAPYDGPKQVTVYKDCNYKGYPVTLPVGDYTVAKLKALGLNNDSLSSIRVPPGYEVTGYIHDNFIDDAPYYFTHDVECFTDLTKGSTADLWFMNDQFSSLKVRKVS